MLGRFLFWLAGLGYLRLYLLHTVLPHNAPEFHHMYIQSRMGWQREFPLNVHSGNIACPSKPDALLLLIPECILRCPWITSNQWKLGGVLRNYRRLLGQRNQFPAFFGQGCICSLVQVVVLYCQPPGVYVCMCDLSVCLSVCVKLKPSVILVF
jgi:hypothetical protein